MVYFNLIFCVGEDILAVEDVVPEMLACVSRVLNGKS